MSLRFWQVSFSDAARYREPKCILSCVSSWGRPQGNLGETLDQSRPSNTQSPYRQKLFSPGLGGLDYEMPLT